ncbi:ABC transporter [Paenibacillus baekrokdamisoli]|uniref:ABC transporter n=1 Tax=Paenibacillus baekrokdamisoli TaxID=1712516 RepID=A0A3G9IYG7_9BACL|nr:ATP-binding cassette domain-containing protein [Paenibacillus baekrokdamisoli]MBB3070178.1 ABC-2 type transport system ATP-binding protein [Paenibacillus baekrokdamisoli]BBH21185.1 ABC transporter [Paenibacillus baekrokdamisoli]
MIALQTRDLCKNFIVKRKSAGLSGSFKSLLRPEWEEKLAVRDINLTVEAGEMVAFLGPNGAGKSTTIKMLTGILHPTSGEAKVLGYTPWLERTKLAYKIGAVFGQKSQLWYHLPPIDSFDLISRIYELKRNDYLTRREDLIERFELGPYLHTPVRKLSLGERMRCEIAASFLHRPRLLFLDEPTIGLDVVVKQRIRELIRELNRNDGTTVFLTSHDAGDMEELCNRAVVIHHGGILLDTPVERLRREVMNRKTLTLTLPEGNAVFDLPQVAGMEIASVEGRRVKLTVDLKTTGIETVLSALIGRLRFDDVTVEDPPMEEIIKYIYGMQRGIAP